MITDNGLKAQPEGTKADGSQQQFKMYYYQNFANSRILRGLLHDYLALRELVLQFLIMRSSEMCFTFS